MRGCGGARTHTHACVSARRRFVTVNKWLRSPPMCIYPFIAFHSWWTGGADCGYGPVATIVLLLIVAVLHIMNGVNYNEEAIGNYHRVLARVRRRRRIAPM